MRKRRKAKKQVMSPTRIRGTYHLSQSGFEVEEVRSLILRRRLQLLVHSFLYYGLDENIISDYTWSMWAEELVKLQKQYPLIAARVDYHQAFKDFDGSTGFDLPYRNPEITQKAYYLLKLEREKKDVRPSGHKTHRAIH